MGVHVGTLTAGALPVCWGAEHRHAGGAAPGNARCTTVPHLPSTTRASAGHHGRQGQHSPPHEAPTSQLTCNCANDSGALYVSLMAVVVHGVSLSVTLVVHPVHLEDVSSGALAALVAVDFFTTEVWTARGLVTYYVAFLFGGGFR
jgi:hypothetical protein